MSFTNMLLGGGWGLGEWPDHIEVVHDACRHESRTYVPERTCRMIDNGVELCCSVCDRRHGYDDEPDFCMGCGAKVVPE